MSVRRALVDCAVLSLQDVCVFYPCCKGCFSRIDVEQQDTTRCRCCKCGYRCLREQVDYRYRLSLRVNRDRCIFGVTVFGNNLNPFFGIHASELQRLVENADGPVGPSARRTLLVKAVQDCFIGRHFIFGIKVTETESGPWFGGPGPNGSSCKDAAQFVASQMVLPKATGLEGCTVVSYYRILLQKASEYELGFSDLNKTSRLPATALLLSPGSPTSSFSRATLSTSGLLSQSLQRSHQDCTFTPTLPWQRSLGVVTSSAEQEESFSTQDSGDENSRHTDNSTTNHPAQRGCLENHKVPEERTPLRCLEQSVYNSPLFVKYPNSSIKKAVGKSPILNTWFSPSQSDHERCSPEVKEFSTRKLSGTFLSNSLAWEDLSFSESLTEFLCEENKDLDIETKPNLNMHYQKETASNNLEITNVTVESSSACQRNTQITDSHSQRLLEVSNTPAPNRGDRQDLSSHVSYDPVECLNRSQARNIFFHECGPEDEAGSLSFEKEEEKQLEGDTYNCSADLFSSSLMISMNTEMLSMPAETVRTTTEAGPLFSKTDQQHLKTENTNVIRSTPNNRKPKRREYTNRDSLITQGTHDFEFVPPSQSTPIIKVGVVSQLPASSTYRNMTGESSSQPDNQDSEAFHGDLHEPDSKTSAETLSVHYTVNAVSAKQLFQCGGESTKENLVWNPTSSKRSHRLAPERRFWKPEKHKSCLQAQPHLKVQRGPLDTGSTRIISRKRDSRFSDEDNEVIVPPTPAGKMRLNMMLRRRRRQIDNSSSNLGSTCEVQKGDGVNCKRTLLDQALTLSHRGPAQTGNCDNETVDDGGPDRSNEYLLDDENQMCDWSRDLFCDWV